MLVSAPPLFYQHPITMKLSGPVVPIVRRMIIDPQKFNYYPYPGNSSLLACFEYILIDGDWDAG